jgi:hypothetical protein
MTILADIAQLEAGEPITAYAKYYHHEHCLWGWQKLAFAIAERQPLLDSKSMDLAHSKHCVHDISRDWVLAVKGEYDTDDYATIAPAFFLDCVWLPWAR